MRDGHKSFAKLFAKAWARIMNLWVWIEKLKVWFEKLRMAQIGNSACPFHGNSNLLP